MVVLELKTTQRTTAMHKKTYQLPCKGQAKLANGLDFTIDTMYQLQTAFGIMALRRALPQHAHVRIGGRVIVCTSDGAISYPCKAAFMTLGLFPAMIEKQSDATARRDTKNVLAKFPSDKSAQTPILTVLRDRGATGAVVTTLRKRYGSVVVTGHRDHQYFLVGLLHDPNQRGATTTKFKTARKFLLEEQVGLRKAITTTHKPPALPSITCCVVTFSNGVYRYHGIRTNNPAAVRKTTKRGKPNLNPKSKPHK